jgi:hypothetical protein
VWPRTKILPLTIGGVKSLTYLDPAGRGECFTQQSAVLRQSISVALFPGMKQAGRALDAVNKKVTVPCGNSAIIPRHKPCR